MATSWTTFDPRDVRRLPREPHVYALYSGDRLVYVGKTINLRNRFSTGHRYNRTLTRAKAKPVMRLHLDLVEQRLIRRLLPAGNLNHTGRPQPRRFWGQR